MATNALEHYRARLRRVLDHVDRHPDGDLGLAALNAVAAFSPHHFHRQFAAALGLPVHAYVQLVRMKRASYRLAFRDGHAVTAIALDSGYQAREAFARAFRRHFGQSPSAFRAAPDWAPWQAALAALDQARSTPMPQAFSPEDVTIADMPDVPVAILTHHGDPATIGGTVRRFIAWRKASGVRPPASSTWNVYHSDPRTTPPAEYRLDLCAGTDRPVAPNDEGVVAGLIPGGRCAMLRVTGGGDLEPAALFLYRDWLPGSGEEPRDFPLYCRRVAFFPDVPEHEAVADLFLPLR